MRIFVPDVGDTVRLTKSWSFGLHQCHANYRALKFFNVEKKDQGPPGPTTRKNFNKKFPSTIVSLPIGTVLQLLNCRIGHPKYPSMFNWRIIKHPAVKRNRGVSHPTILVLLEDVNKMIVELIDAQ